MGKKNSLEKVKVVDSSFIKLLQRLKDNSSLNKYDCNNLRETQYKKDATWNKMLGGGNNVGL